MAFLLKILVLVIAITMAAATITITMKAIPESGPKPELNHHPDDTSTTAPVSVPPSKRVSRFLQAATTSHPSANPRAADHCKNDNDICSVVLGVGGKCCNNKCMDLSSDKNNCGACKNKCKFTHTCCNGQCVMTMFDKRHCGRCNNRCPEGQYCVYGMCNYG